MSMRGAGATTTVETKHQRRHISRTQKHDVLGAFDVTPSCLGARERVCLALTVSTTPSNISTGHLQNYFRTPAAGRQTEKAANPATTLLLATFAPTSPHFKRPPSPCYTDMMQTDVRIRLTHPRHRCMPGSDASFRSPRHHRGRPPCPHSSITSESRVLVSTI